MDAKVSPSVNDSEDFSWNAVWESATTITENGWQFEMFIPFSAIRFSKKIFRTGALMLPGEGKKNRRTIYVEPNFTHS